MSGANYRDLAHHDAIALEPVGYIWYRNEYRDYFGLSSAVVFTNGVGTGVGPFLHFGRVAKVGYVFPTRRGDVDPARRSGGVLFSVDLYKYLSDRGAQVEGVMKSLQAKLEKP